MSQSSTLVKNSTQNKSHRGAGSSQRAGKPKAPAALDAPKSSPAAIEVSNSSSTVQNPVTNSNKMAQNPTPATRHSGQDLLFALQNPVSPAVDPIKTSSSQQTPTTKETRQASQKGRSVVASSARSSPQPKSQPQPPPTPSSSPEKGKRITHDTPLKSSTEDSENKHPPSKPPTIVDRTMYNQMMRHLGIKPVPPPEEVPKAIEDLARQISKNEFPELEALRARLQVPTPPPSPPTAQIVPEGKEECSNEASSQPRSTIPLLILDRTISEAACVRFGDGLSVDMITLPSDCTRITVSGISADVKFGELGWYLQAYGKVAHKELSPDSSGATAHIRFTHHQEATAAVAKLDGKPELGTATPLTACLDTSIAPNLSASNLLTDTIIIRWSPPRPRLKLYYKEPRVARQEAEVINRRPFEGQRLRAWLSTTRHIVWVDGLSPDADLQEIVRRHAPDSHPIFLENYKHEEAMEQIDSLVRDAAGLQTKRLKETTDAVTVAAQFYTSEEAETFLRKVSSTEISWSRAAKLSIIHACDLVYVLGVDKYCTIKAQIDDLRARLAEAGIQLWVLKPKDHPQYRHIKIMGSRYVKDHKPLIDDILNGQTVMRDDKPFWDADLELFHGVGIFTRFDISGVQIIADTKRKRITVFGLEEDRAHAIQCIFQRVSMEKKRLTYHSFPRWQLPYWDVEGGGGGILMREFGRDKVFLDARNSRIIVAGERAERLLETMKRRAPRRQHRNNGNTNKSQCPVCLEEPTHGILLNCNHTYCKTCLSRYIASAHKSDTPFPLQCFASNNSCNTPIPLLTMKRLLSDDELERAMTRSFATYINSRPQEFRHCPTGDCSQLFRVRPRSDSVEPSQRCSSCLYKTCPACFAEGGHDGKTCAQHEAWLAEREVEKEKEAGEWIKSIGGRVCPKCKTVLVKDGGCAHVQCSRCKVHICWTCGKPFEEVGEESVYEHMRREHGGIGLIDWETNDDVDIPRYDIEYDAPTITPPQAPAPAPAPRSRPPPSQPPQASTSGSSGRLSRPTNNRNQQNQKRKPWRRPQYYSDYGRDELSEDENDDFGNGEWDHDFGDMNWEAL